MILLKKIFLRLLYPGMILVLLLTPICGAALIFILTSDRGTSPIGIIVYVLSAYTLTVLILGIPKFTADIRAFINENKKIANVKAHLYENKYTGLYLTSIPARIKASLYMTLFVNLTYAVLKMATGIYYASFWFGAEAVFYLVLGLVRFLMLRNMRKGGDLRHEYQVYRFCGFLLFALNAALTGIVYQMIHQGRGNDYPGLLIYVVATYTFIFLITSVVHLIKYRKLNSPIISAAKVINLTTALVALYSLQIAMFASFGEDKNVERVMNSISGSLLCIAIFGMAVFMVVRGFEKLKKLRK
jgi:hypothetical protein